MKLSIVATLYHSQPYIEEFYKRASQSARQLVGDAYEIVLVNDGSPDDSLEIVVNLTHRDKHIVVVDLSRNFGHHKAMMTGLAYAQGEHVFLIDSDLEEEPEWMSGFSERMEQDHCDVVYGVQKARKGGWFERCSGTWFYTFFRKLTGLALPRNAVTARLMTRRYVDALLQYRERDVFLFGLFHVAGFLQSAEEVSKHSSSETTYSFKKKIALLINAVTAFSNAPLESIFYVGLIISMLSGAYISYTVIRWIFLSYVPSGWTSVIASIWLLGGLIILFIGVIGIYLARIFSETKQRPYTIVRHVYGRNTDSSEKNVR